jgi:ubiquinone/menaquinone biosynthesis C-methylase UbiE
MNLEDEKERWNKIAAAWEKWERVRSEMFEATGRKIIELAELKPSDRVLDVGTGHGEPGLSAAKIVRDGNVTGLDISENMLKLAEKNAGQKGIRNFAAVLYDGLKIPFADESFDAVISRHGAIFYPDMEAGLKEILRVLKGGGRIAVSGWREPKDNESGFIVRKIISEQLSTKIAQPGEPGPYRFSDKGYISNALKRAGFRKAREVEVTGTHGFESPGQYWQFISETQIPIANAIEKEGSELAEKLKGELLKLAEPFKKGEGLEFRWRAVVGAGEK